MICHQGSARASPRLQQLCQQPKVSPHTQRNAFHPAPYPKNPHGTPMHPPHGVCAPGAGQPPGGRCHPHPLAGQLSQAWDIGKTPSIPSPPRQKLRVWEGGPRSGWEQAAQMSRAARQAPAAAARGSCPVPKAIPELRVQGVPGCLQARQQPPQNPSGMVDLEGYFKPLLK